MSMTFTQPWFLNTFIPITTIFGIFPNNMLDHPNILKILWKRKVSILIGGFMVTDFDWWDHFGCTKIYPSYRKKSFKLVCRSVGMDASSRHKLFAKLCLKHSPVPHQTTMLPVTKGHRDMLSWVITALTFNLRMLLSLIKGDWRGLIGGLVVIYCMWWYWLETEACTLQAK